MDTPNLILQAVMMISQYDYDDDTLSTAIESEAALMAGLPADTSEHDTLFN